MTNSTGTQPLTLVSGTSFPSMKKFAATLPILTGDLDSGTRTPFWGNSRVRSRPYALAWGVRHSGKKPYRTPVATHPRPYRQRPQIMASKLNRMPPHSFCRAVSPCCVAERDF